VDGNKEKVCELYLIFIILKIKEREYYFSQAASPKGI